MAERELNWEDSWNRNRSSNRNTNRNRNSHRTTSQPIYITSNTSTTIYYCPVSSCSNTVSNSGTYCLSHTNVCYDSGCQERINSSSTRCSQHQTHYCSASSCYQNISIAETYCLSHNNQKKVKGKETTVEDIQKILDRSDLYGEKLRKVKEKLPTLLERIEGFGDFPNSYEIQKIVRDWGNFKVFSKYEEIKKWTEEWKKEVEAIKCDPWQRDNYTTHIEVFQPPKIFRPSR